MAWFADDAVAAARPAEPRGTTDDDPRGSVPGAGRGGAQPADPATVACQECGGDNALLRCSRCGVPYCSQECQRRAWKGHKAVCQKPSQGQAGGGAASSSAPASGNAVASTTPSAPEERPLDLRSELTGPRHAGWHEYLAERGVVRKAELQKLKEREAFALAILHALQKMPPDIPLEAVNGRCVVWVLGARDGIEKRQILVGGWEPLFSALQVAWDVVLVGPEMMPDANVRLAPGRRIYTYACLTHEAEMQDHLKRPSFICALNTGIGANVVHHMRSWIPTLGEMLLLGRPVLFTCFGLHEARVETQIFKALRARFASHREGGFSHVLEPDKPLSVCNAMFTWVHGSKLSPEQLTGQAIPYVDAQLRGSELFHFLKEARSHVNILADPDNAAHSGWAEMYDGRFVPCLKQALEDDDDGRGGVQTIVRCTMKTVHSASQNPLAAAVLLDLGVEPALATFGSWARRGHWTSHDWMLEEVVQRVGETEAFLRGSDPRLVDVDAGEGDLEEPFFCSYLIRANSTELRAAPARGSPVVAKVQSGKVLHTLSHRGLWLRVTHGNLEGWLLGYEDKSNVGDMTGWDIQGWDL